MHLSVYIRLLSLLSISILGVLLYFWQLRFNTNKTLAATFAISAFTIPAYQVFAATANYFLIITALLLTFISLFYWHNSFTEKNEQKKKRYFYLGCGFFFASLLQYPLSSMYAWVLLFICYLNPLLMTSLNNPKNKEFFYKFSLVTIGMMIFYYLFIIVFHKIFHVNVSYGRPAVIETTHLVSRLLSIFHVLAWHANLWCWDSIHHELQSPIYYICLLFIFAIFYAHISNKIYNVKAICKNIGWTFVIAFSVFFLAYSPIFATSEVVITYRYTLATMPILLYIIFWSINTLATLFSAKLHRNPAFFCQTLVSLFFISVTAFGVSYANIMTADGIVGPHAHDVAYVQQQLINKVIPELKNGKQVVIHARDCDSGHGYQYGANVPTALEYGMRYCQYQQQVIGVIFHSLMAMGYLPNNHGHNNVIYNENEIIVKDTPLGSLIVNSTSDSKSNLQKYAENKHKIVSIDMREIPPYQHFDFYKELFASIRKG